MSVSFEHRRRRAARLAVDDGTCRRRRRLKEGGQRERESHSQHNKQHRSRLVRVRRQPRNVVPARKVQHAAEHEIGYLRHNVARHKRRPVVHIRLFLARLENVAPLDEERLQLRHDAGGHEDEVEDGEEDELEVGDGVADPVGRGEG